MTEAPRRRAISIAGRLLAAGGVAADVALVVVHYVRRPWDADFRIFFAAATAGRDAGWAGIYDQSRIRAVEMTLGPGPYWAYLNPPPLAWLAAPFTLLPYRAGLALWTLVLVAAFVFALHLARPALEGGRWTWALAAACFAFPVVFGITEGQPTALLMLSAVAAWRLLRTGRDGLAGAVLGVTLLKPHLAWLVPLVFLVAGRPRVVLGYLAVLLPVAALSAVSLGPAGLTEWLAALTATRSTVPPPLFILPAFLPTVPALALEIGAAIFVLISARRRRRDATPALLLSMGLAGSLVAAPYLNIQDLSLLVAAGWLLWPEALSRGAKALLGTVYLALLISPGTSLLVLPAEATWLGTTWWRRPALPPGDANPDHSGTVIK